MSTSSGPEPWRPLAQVQGGCAVAFGGFLLLGAGAMVLIWQLDRQDRARVDESWEREAERVTSVYDAISRDVRAGTPGSADQASQNHREMAQLLKDRPSSREGSGPRAWRYVLLIVIQGGAGVFLLVRGLRARNRASGVPSGPVIGPPAEPLG